MLDLNQVAIFVDVVQGGSFAAAARRWGRPPNFVSRHVQYLETALGKRLFHRSTRKLTLTAAGRALFDSCANAIADLTRATAASIEDPNILSGTIRVAAPDGFFDFFAPDWVAQFLAANPKVRLEFALSDAKSHLIEESIDVAFRAGSLVERHYVGQKLAVASLGIVASPKYLAVRGTPKSLQALSTHDCVLQADRPGSVVWRLEGRRGKQDVPVIGRFSANTAAAVLKATVAGIGIALLPEPITAADVAAGRLVKIFHQYRRVGAGIFAVYPNREHISRVARSFVEFVAQHLLVS